jgi:hypothetical protein
MKLLLISTLMLFFFATLYANAIIIEWKAEPEQDKIVLQWKTSQEIDVVKFVVERSNDNLHFSDIGEVLAQGPGFLYRFEDDRSDIMNSIFYYRLRIVNKNGSTQHNDSLPVITHPSTVKNTWGSIKALFR